MQSKFRVSMTPSACPVPRNQLSTPLSPFSSCYQSMAPFSPLICSRTPFFQIPFASPSLPSHAPTQIGKRKRADEKENELPQHFNTTAGSMSTSKKPKYSARRNNQQRLEDAFEAMKMQTGCSGNFCIMYSVSPPFSC